MVFLFFFSKRLGKFDYIYKKNMMHFLYFDPGLGAMIIQAIVAAVAGVLLFSKNLLFKVKVLFGLVKSNDKDLFDDINVKDSDSEHKQTTDSE